MSERDLGLCFAQCVSHRFSHDLGHALALISTIQERGEAWLRG